MAIISGFHPDDLSSNLSIRSNEDIHRTIAAKIFNIPPDAVTADQRRIARSFTRAIFFDKR